MMAELKTAMIDTKSTGSVAPYCFNGLTVNLEGYQGSLELLLFLVRRNQASIYDIPVAQITEQFLDHLAVMEEMNIQVASEFTVLAATLLYLKSALLLPEAEGADEDEEEADELSPANVKAALTQQLAEYEQYRDAASDLSERQQVWANMFHRGAGNANGNGLQTPAKLDLGSVSLFDLLSVVHEVLDRLPADGSVPIPTRKVSLSMRVRHVLTVLKKKMDGVVFVELCEDCLSRFEVVVTFIAVLSVIRRREARAEQSEPFGPIRLLATIVRR